MNKRNKLSETELLVLQEIARGRDNHQIATILVRSHETIRTHAKNILRKLGARNRAHAVAIAYHVGIFQGRPQPISTETQSPLTPPPPAAAPESGSTSAQQHTQPPSPRAITSAPSRRRADTARDPQ
ncbi:response regulator transcription factor [Amycolatopsis anabasis]|uniref:response regulator transcription factor n=1 Tax=Amycolatopsis anabasis TaxID=1840409 RepID=UPI001C555F97|nr:helix-turn-helix transcriptional regulator [Amycolatopsis anabasis]